MKRSFPSLRACLLASLALNAVIAVAWVLPARTPPAFGQAAGEGFILGTEKGADQSPVCFVLRTADPHLVVYRVDALGALQLVGSRDIKADLALQDRHFPQGQLTPFKTTLPRVRDVLDEASRRPEPAETEKKADGGK